VTASIPANIPGELAASYPDAPGEVAVNGSCTVDLLNADGSFNQTLGTQDFGKYPQLWNLTLPAGHGSDVTLRLTKVSDGLAFADSFLVGGITPTAVTGDAASDAYTERKLASADLDVLEITDQGVEVSFANVPAGAVNVALVADIEPEVIVGLPFYLDAHFYKDAVDSVSGVYHMDKPLPDGITVDSDSDPGATYAPADTFPALAPADAFGIYHTHPVTGHPDSDAYIWLYNDADYLYAFADWGDNTYDYGKDFFSVFADTPGGISLGFALYGTGAQTAFNYSQSSPFTENTNLFFAAVDML